ncbi:hypothetical protein F4604DRAFT_1932662 [Suillus subluteus]|nr:hypothetical protein F4604DRAFT_1932662 [Suillus subluteus]
MDKELLKERKHTYRQWFHNHKKVQTNSKAPTKPKKKWTAWRVIEEERKAEILQQIWEEIEEETGEKPAHKEEAEAKADKWTNQAPDAAVQAKTARKKGEKMVKNFAKEMFTQAGMRVFVLGSWKDEKGGLLTSGFDFNEQLIWEEFIGNAFDHAQDQDATLLGGTRQVPKPYHEFKLDRSGSPMLPEMDNLSLETKKALIWSFLTIHYRTCCGKPKVLVPWSNIMKGQSRFISSTYLPDDTKILEPSKMLHTDANAILDFCSTEEECEKTEAEASPPAVQQRLHGRANAEDTNRSDDRPVPKSFGKCARGHKDQPSVSHHQTPPTAKTIISVPHVTEESDQSTEASRVTHSFGPRSTRQGMETRRGLEHLCAPPMIQPPALMRTRAARDASPVVQEKQPENVPATREHEPRKAKSARFAPGVPSDAPAKGTRSNAGNTRMTRTRQKPKRYTDYI